MISLRIFIISILFLSAFSNSVVHAQFTNEAVWEENFTLGVKPQLEGKQPTGLEFKWVETSYFNSSKPNYHQAFESIDQNFIALTEVLNFPISPEDSVFVFAFNPNFSKYSMDSLYLGRVERDMQHVLGDNYRSLKESPVKYYSPRVAKKKFNADHALTYPLVRSKEKHLHIEDKKNCQVIIMQKNGRGFVALYCYYNDMSKKQLKAYIRAAEGIFRYRDPEDFIESSNILTEPVDIPELRKRKESEQR